MWALVAWGAFLGSWGTQVALCRSLGGEGLTELKHAGRGEGDLPQALVSQQDIQESPAIGREPGQPFKCHPFQRPFVKLLTAKRTG